MTTSPVSATSRTRWSRADIARLRGAMYELCERYRPVTVRQGFYRLVASGLIDKTENEYRSTVSRLLTQMRRDGDLPYDWIADNTRWMRKPTTFDSAESALQRTARLHWQDLLEPCASSSRGLEKEALAGVLYEVIDEFDVPLMVTRGYSSVTFLHGAASEIAASWIEDRKRTHTSPTSAITTRQGSHRTASTWTRNREPSTASPTEPSKTADRTSSF